jgi:hypothetical protein
MSYLDQISNIQNSLFSYQDQLQTQQDDIIANVRSAMEEKIQNVAEKMEFIGTAGVAGIEGLGKIKQIGGKLMEAFEKGKEAISKGQDAIENIGAKVEGAVSDIKGAGQRILSGIQQTSENLGFGEQTSAITGSLSQGLEEGAQTLTSGLQSGIQQIQSGISQAVESGQGALTSASQTLEETTTAVQNQLTSGLTSAQEMIGQNILDPLRGSMDAFKPLELPDFPGLSDITMSDPGETLLTRAMGAIPTDIGSLEASIISQQPEVSSVIAGIRELAQGPGSSINIGDVINQFVAGGKQQLTSTLQDSAKSLIQSSQDQIDQMKELAFNQDPEAINTVGDLTQDLATKSLSAFGDVKAGISQVSEIFGDTSAGVSSGIQSIGETAGKLVSKIAGSGTEALGETVGEGVGEAVSGGVSTLVESATAIGSAVLDAVPVVGELAMVGTALYGIFESIFKHPPKTQAPEIVSSVGYDPSSLTSSFSGEGGTV